MNGFTQLVKSSDAALMEESVVTAARSRELTGDDWAYLQEVSTALGSVVSYSWGNACPSPVNMTPETGWLIYSSAGRRFVSDAVLQQRRVPGDWKPWSDASRAQITSLDRYYASVRWPDFVITVAWADARAIQNIEEQSVRRASLKESPEILPIVTLSTLRYLGGLAGYRTRTGSFSEGFHGDHWSGRMSGLGITIFHQDVSFPKKAPKVALALEWPKLTAVTFCDGGSTSNVLALAAFGPLGLGSRMHEVVLEIWPRPDACAVFALPGGMATAHRILQFARNWPAAKGLIRLASQPPTEPEALSMVSQLTQVERMYRDGNLTDDEWQRLKGRLLSQ